MASSASASVLNSIATAKFLELSRNASASSGLRFQGVQGLGFGSSLSSSRPSRSSAPSRLVAMATESPSDSTTSDLLKEVQEAWEKTDDKLAIGGLGFAGLILLWASTGLISAIDKLPILPTLFELIGLLFTGWFIYRYLLFKPDREELFKLVDETKSKITGSSE